MTLNDPPVPSDQLARHTDPDTSHDAARKLITGRSHCAKLLRAHYRADMPHIRERYPDTIGLTDAEAAAIAGLDVPGICWWHRCSDLRKLGLIAWALDAAGNPIKRPGANGRDVRASVITNAGRRVYNDLCEEASA